MPYKDPERQRLFQRGHYSANKPIWRERTRARRAELKRWFEEEVVVNLRCSKCGEDDPACLDFHHRDPNQKDMAIRKMVQELRNQRWILDEIKKCIVLCANCHRKLHRDMRKVSNGG